MRLRILLGTADSERGGVMQDSVQEPVVRTNTLSSANALPLDAIKEAIDEDTGNPPSFPPEGEDAPEIPYFVGDYTAEIDKQISYSLGKVKAAPKQKWRPLYILTIAVLDFTIMTGVSILLFFLRPGLYKTVLGDGIGISPIIFSFFMGAMWLISLAACFTYQKHTMTEGYELYAKIINATVVDFVVVASFSFLLQLDLSRIVLVISPLLAGALTLIERWLMRRFLHLQRRQGRMVYPTVVIGSPKGIKVALEQISLNPSLGYAPMAVCPIEKNVNGSPYTSSTIRHHAYHTMSGKKLEVLVYNSHLAQTARRKGAQTVFIADVLDRSSIDFSAFSLAVEVTGMDIAVGAHLADISGHLLRLRNVSSDLPVLSARLPQYSYPMQAFKRLIDIVLSMIGIVIASPIMFVTAILIKKEDGGPIFYKQERVGRFGEKFMIFKFRSMRVDADTFDKALADQVGLQHGILFKPKEDPRVTRVGRFIRKWSIDELPQFFNVFLGTMSMVGPRPQQQYEVDEYSPIYSTRLLVKPGVTGPWQVSGRSDLSVDQAERLDVNYVENWSITTDLAILLKTVIAVFKHEGSY